MISRFNYKPPKKRDSSHDDEFISYELKETIEVISTHKDGSVDKYIKKSFYEKKVNSWKEFIESYNLGSVSEQVMNHLDKGTPLVTGHVLPPADYTKLEKGAEIKREMSEKGVTFDMVVQAVKAAMTPKSEVKQEETPQKEGEK